MSISLIAVGGAVVVVIAVVCIIMGLGGRKGS